MVCGSKTVYTMILTKEDIEIVADSILCDFMSKEKESNGHTPINKLATDYLGLKVTFEKLSDDNSLLGITAYEDTSFIIKVDGYRRVLRIKKNQIILDNSFVEIGKVEGLCGKRRFTLAHEVSHQILYHMQSEEEKNKTSRRYSMRTSNEVKGLQTEENWNEWQANYLGAALLMPRNQVLRFMENYLIYVKNEVPVTKQKTQLRTEVIIYYFSNHFKVSKTAAMIRLKQLGYINDEYRFNY